MTKQNEYRATNGVDEPLDFVEPAAAHEVESPPLEPRRHAAPGGNSAPDRTDVDPPSASQFDAAFRWALDTSFDPAMASADWLAMDIDNTRPSAEALLSNSGASLVQLRKAKSAYKTMRIVGETSADRRLGARLYAASIAAALVWHGKRISRQSDTAMARAFEGLARDAQMSDALRSLAGRALALLDPETPPPGI
jgi:hypothetical protein